MRVGIAGYGVVGKKRYSSIIKNTSFKVTDISEVNLIARDEIPDGVNVFDNYQDLISKADNLYTYDIGKYYLVFQNDNKKLINFYLKKFKAKKTDDSFIYTSDSNNKFLKIKDLKSIFLKFKECRLKVTRGKSIICRVTLRLECFQRTRQVSNTLKTNFKQ